MNDTDRLLSEIRQAVVLLGYVDDLPISIRVPHQKEKWEAKANEAMGLSAEGTTPSEAISALHTRMIEAVRKRAAEADPLTAWLREREGR